MIFTEFAKYLKTNLSLEIDKKQEEQLLTYLSMLQEWNKLFNLTAISESEQIIEKHFLDSLIPLKYFKPVHKSLIDIGTGAGFPGLVIAIMSPLADVTLLEPNNKKIRFLEAVKEKLGLDNVTIISGRAENLKSSRETFDIAIARAVKPLNVLLELAIPLVKTKGLFIAMKSQNVNDEIALSKKAFSLLKCRIANHFEDYLPTEKDVRINLFIVKNDVTPLKYPRAFNLISAKPL